MFQMIEITERSNESFSEAAKQAIQKLLHQGKKIHFFEVVEQRGAVKKDQSLEYQIVLKVAIEV